MSEAPAFSLETAAHGRIDFARFSVARYFVALLRCPDPADQTIPPSAVVDNIAASDVLRIGERTYSSDDELRELQLTLTDVERRSFAECFMKLRHEAAAKAINVPDSVEDAGASTSDDPVDQLCAWWIPRLKHHHEEGRRHTWAVESPLFKAAESMRNSSLTKAAESMRNSSLMKTAEAIRNSSLVGAVECMRARQHAFDKKLETLASMRHVTAAAEGLTIPLLRISQEEERRMKRLNEAVAGLRATTDAPAEAKATVAIPEIRATPLIKHVEDVTRAIGDVASIQHEQRQLLERQIEQERRGFDAIS